MPGGRPTDYSEEIIIKTEEYLKSCVDEIEEYHKTRGDKSDTYERLVRVRLPTIEGLAVYLGISKETIYQWEKDPEKSRFSDVIGKLRAKQADALINNGLSGDYNPTIAKVLLTKHGYREGLEQTGKDGSTLIPDSSNEIKTLAQQINELNRNRGTSIPSNGANSNIVDTEI